MGDEDRVALPSNTDGLPTLIMGKGVLLTTPITVGTAGAENQLCPNPLPDTRYLVLWANSAQPEDPVVGKTGLTTAVAMFQLGRGAGAERVLEGTRTALKTFFGRASVPTVINVSQCN
jgi:hypothetical protein